MKFVLYLSKRILLIFIALLIPTAIAFACYSIIKLGIKPYNVGIRSIFNIIINQLPLIVFTSYAIAIIFSIVLIDKTKINSILHLYIPPIIITFVILSIFYVFNSKDKLKNFFITSNKNIQIGANTIFKQSVFNNADNRVIYVRYKKGKLIYFLYDKSKDALVTVKKITYTNNRLIIYPSRNKYLKKAITINYKNLPQNKHLFSNKLIKMNSSKLEKLTKKVKNIYFHLNQKDKLIFLSSFIMSFIIFIVPLSFLVNDGGWGITGLIGVTIILTILPFLYNLIFTLEFKYKNLFSFLGKYYAKYSYLICPIGFLILGFLMNIFIKLFRKAEV